MDNVTITKLLSTGNVPGAFDLALSQTAATNHNLHNLLVRLIADWQDNERKSSLDLIDYKEYSRRRSALTNAFLYAIQHGDFPKEFTEDTAAPFMLIPKKRWWIIAIAAIFLVVLILLFTRSEQTGIKGDDNDNNTIHLSK